MEELLNLKEYLKKYSTIRTSFIDDFYSLYNYNTNDNDFVIDLDVLAKWLNSKKKHLKETLVYSYVEDKDFTITKKDINTGGRKSELILLTPDCMKRLCMSSRTEKAEDVRSYFIKLEEHIAKYKNYIISGLSKKIDNIGRTNEHIPNPQNGVIYVLQSSKDLPDVYKLGKTKKFRQRIRVHQSSHLGNVKIKHIYETTDIDSVETCLKGILKKSQLKKRKEFYQIKLDDLKELIENCDKLRLKAKYSTTQSKKDFEKNHFILFEKTNKSIS